MPVEEKEEEEATLLTYSESATDTNRPKTRLKNRSYSYFVRTLSRRR
jgi:hypothetical protein